MAILPVRFLRCAAWLLAACELYAAEPDRAVLAVMRSSASDIDHVQLIKRIAVNAELDLVVALGAPKDWSTGQGSSIWWGRDQTLAILLQRRTRPNLIYKIATSKGEGDCEARIERATAKDVVLSCMPEKGTPGPNHRFVYDIRSKALIKHIQYEPFSLERIFVAGQEAVLVGSDHQQLVAVNYNPANEPAFHLLKEAQAQPWTQRMEISVGTEGVGSSMKTVIQLKPKPFKPARFGPGNRLTLIQEGETQRLIVLDRINHTVKRYPLPQSSYDTFARLRPLRARYGYTRQSTTIDEGMGPWQMVNSTLWFAKTFYDSEGDTGVGGFGYFDAEQRKYQIYSPSEMRDWSTTAMLVEPEAVWLALANQSEYRTSGGGLLRFDRATQKVERIKICDVVNEMARVGDHLLLATECGTAVLRGDTLHRFFLDQTTDGRLQVSESVFGN